MRIFVITTFERAAKKLHRLHKDELDAAVRTIGGDSKIGEEKVGGLAGIRVYKFRVSNELWLLSYRLLNEDSIKLLTIGTHENFDWKLRRKEH